MKSLLFVDDDPNLLSGLKRGLHSLRNQWQMFYADSGKEALKLLETTAVDVVVSDYRMPEMNGYVFLQEVRRQDPEIIRIMLTGQPDRETYAKSINLCHYFLWKPLDISAFIQLLDRLMKLDNILSNEQLQRLINGLTTLPTLPGTYHQLVALLDNAEADVKHLVNLIRDDAVLTLQILKLVNSSAIGLVRHISDLQEAVNYLGLNTLRSLVLAHHIFSSFSAEQTQEFKLEDLWKHSCTTARIAEALVQNHKDNYIAAHASFGGLLHDIGKLVLTYCLPEAARDISRIQLADNLSNVEAEIQVIGTTHAAVGAYLANLWGLPHPVVEAIYLHHQSHIVGFDGLSKIAVAVWHANRISNGELECSPKEVELLRGIPNLLSPREQP